MNIRYNSKYRVGDIVYISSHGTIPGFYMIVATNDFDLNDNVNGGQLWTHKDFYQASIRKLGVYWHGRWENRIDIGSNIEQNLKKVC